MPCAPLPITPKDREKAGRRHANRCPAFSHAILSSVIVPLSPGCRLTLCASAIPDVMFADSCGGSPVLALTVQCREPGLPIQYILASHPVHISPSFSRCEPPIHSQWWMLLLTVGNMLITRLLRVGVMSSPVHAVVPVRAVQPSLAGRSLSGSCPCLL